MSTIESRSLQAQDIKWWMFDPCVKPLVSYHQLIVEALTQPISSENPAFDLAGRIVKIASIPLGYPILGLFALIGKVFERAIGGDFAYKNRLEHIGEAATSGNLEVLKKILLQKRMSSHDLIYPLRAVVSRGSDTVNLCAEEILKEIRLDELNPTQREELRGAARSALRNENPQMHVKIMEKLGETQI